MTSPLPSPPSTTDAALRRLLGAIDHPLLRLYSRLRYYILPREEIEAIDRFLPERGVILDLACGFGLFVNAFAQTHPDCTLIGCDLDRRRLATGRRLAQRLGLTNVRFLAADLEHYDPPKDFQGVCLLFILHHMPRETALELLLRLIRALPLDGRLAIEEILTHPWHKALYCRVMDRLHAGPGFVRYWSLKELTGVLEALGCEVEARDVRTWTPYPQGVCLARKVRRLDEAAFRQRFLPQGRYRPQA